MLTVTQESGIIPMSWGNTRLVAQQRPQDQGTVGTHLKRVLYSPGHPMTRPLIPAGSGELCGDIMDKRGAYLKDNLDKIRQWIEVEKLSYKVAAAKLGSTQLSIASFARRHGIAYSKPKRPINSGSYTKKYSVNENFFDVIGPVQAYILGLYAADGNVTNTGVVSISQSGERGKALVEWMKQQLEYSGPIYHTKTIGQDSFQLTFSSKVIAKRLYEYCITPRKSLTLKYPINLPHGIDIYFIRGYFDGDGSTGIYHTNTRTPIFIASFVGTPDFINHCVDRIPVKGLLHKIHHAKNLVEIRFNGTAAIKFGQWLWSDKSLPYYYKQAKMDEFLRNYTTKYIRYEPKRQLARKLCIDGLNCMQISKIVELPFQTVYKWKYQRLLDE